MSDHFELTQVDQKQTIINLVLDGLSSPHSKRSYTIYLNQFLDWYASKGKPGLNKATVNEYRRHCEEQGYSPSSINSRVTAVRRLAAEMADNGIIDTIHANGIARVKGVKSQSVHTGKWLSRVQVETLLDLPDTTTLKGLRDRALLSVLVGSGLRREEETNLTFDKIIELEGRWVILDIVGKGNKPRTIPIASWVKQAIDDWSAASGINAGAIFRYVNKGGRVVGDGITTQAVGVIVRSYAEKMGMDFSPHDLRRTFAKLAYKGGAGLDQIQLSLGHASLKTTERYLGVKQSITDSPSDHLNLFQ